MMMKHFLLRCLHDIRLLVQYRQYTHRRLATLAAALSLLWLVYYFVSVLLNRDQPYVNPPLDHWCDREELPSYFNLKDPEEITIVTGFFSLGSMDDASPLQQKQWMKPLGRVANPMVAYFDDERDAAYFRELRSCLPESRTKVVVFKRKFLWSFQLRPQFQRVYYKNSGNSYRQSAMSDRIAASHAKYELLQRTVTENPFKTQFFAWLDAGYFRTLDSMDVAIFKMIPPGTFNPDMVSMSQAYPHDPNIPAEEVLAHRLPWVSGKMLLGTGEALVNFTKLYRETVEHLLKNDLVGSDEQVIYLMYSTKLRRPKQIMIKTYMCHEGQLGLYGMDTRYLCLGYVSRNAWEKIHKPG